jgi:uncharacterized protein YcgL (UPF0745 family)
MRCVVYKSLKKFDTYLYVEQADEFGRVPEALRMALGKLAFVMELDLTPDRKLAQADVHKVREQLAAEGFYLQLPPNDRPFDAAR